jgi:APA family basic amino acid/polyamine antiporter
VARGWSGYLGALFHSLNIELPPELTKLPIGVCVRVCVYVYVCMCVTSHSLTLHALSTNSLDEGGWFVCDFIAPTVVLLLTALLCFGVKGSARFNNAMVVVTLLIVVFVIVSGLTFADLSNWTPFAPFGVSGVTSAAAMIVFAYIGFDAVACTAEEVKNPNRDLPIGIIGSLVLSTALYMLVSAVVTLMVPYDLIDVDAPLAEAFSKQHNTIITKRYLVEEH